jgi:hypothetical protein
VETRKECIVSFRTAEKLKEIGFDEPCFGLWDCGDEEMYSNSRWFRNGDSKEDEPHISAPTLYLVQKWLREVHLIYLLVEKSDYGPQWICAIKRDGRSSFWADGKEHGSRMSTYEEALDDGIFMVLESIILTKKS